MPKWMKIKPQDFLQGKDINLGTIPVMKYNRTLKEEIKSKKLSTKDAIEMYRQMFWIRTYEMFLDEIKIKSEWKGVPYAYYGPAHMATGQEAAVVGAHFMLTKDDFIFGTHRNHAEVISKGLSAIYKMEDKELEKIMKEYFNESILHAVNSLGKKWKSSREKMIFYFMYGFTCEVWGKATGFNKGLSGSMHLFFTPLGIYPNNAIVGASGCLGLGAALFKLCNNQPGISIANVGDGGIGTGPVWEALNFAAMDQYKELWPKGYQKRPPFMMNVMNNGYAMGGQTIGETMGNKGTARLGASINPEICYAEVVNGQNPLAVWDLMNRKYDLCAKGEGPVVNEIRTYRYNGHSSGDLESYRVEEEIKEFRKYDPLILFSKELIDAKVLTDKEIKAINQEIEEVFLEIYKLSIDPKITTELDWSSNEVLEDMMFSREQMPLTSFKKIELSQKKSENPRVQRISKRSRFGFDENGKPLSKMRTMQLRDAIFEAVIDRFQKEPSLIAYGEELRDWGGAYGVFNGLTELVPYQRFFNSPIAEAAIVGTAVGYALSGGQALVELEYFDFLFRAGDEISNQISKWRAMSGGQLRIPVVIRTNIGSGYGVQHSQDYTSVISAITGINLVVPATPYDAKGLLNTALNLGDPTIFVETQKLYDKPELFVKEGVPKDYYEVPFGKGVYRRKGEDITIVTLGASLYRGIEAADELKAKWDINAEIIDMRSAVPFDYDILVESIKKTGKMIFVNEGFERNNYMKNVAHNLVELAYDEFDSPPVVLGARNWIMPGAEYEKYIYPQKEDILAAIHNKIMHLKDYTPVKVQTNVDLIRRYKKGV